MRIVIDISEKDKEIIDDMNFVTEKLKHRIGRAIMNGIVLPKGHGRLGDLDALWDKFLKYSDYEGAGKNYTGDEELIHRDSAMYVVENAPTILAADTEVEK